MIEPIIDRRPPGYSKGAAHISKAECCGDESPNCTLKLATMRELLASAKLSAAATITLLGIKTWA